MVSNLSYDTLRFRRDAAHPGGTHWPLLRFGSLTVMSGCTDFERLTQAWINSRVVCAGALAFLANQRAAVLR